MKSVATHSRSYFAVAILVRHTGIQSPNNSHARTHSVNSEDQGPVGFVVNARFTLSKVDYNPCFRQSERGVAVLFPLNKKD